MNKILNINLGGYALTIDDDAYEYLSAYLESIRRRFSESEGRDEIMHDIESRLGELISNNMGTRTIVMLPDVEAAIEVMGKPEDFGGEPVEKPGTGGKKAFQPGKKLFRDEDDAVIGGVCSGLSAYFGIQESIWMRLIFILLALISFGFWVPAYLLLWILVPPARTAAERLAMRGETPNVENIAREIEQGFERFSKKVNEFGAQAGSSSVGRTSASVASGCLTVFGKLVLGFVIFVALMMVLGLGTAWVAGIWAFFTAQPYISYFSPLSSGGTYIAFFNAFFLIGIPIVGLVLWLGRTIFRFKSPAWLGSGLSIFWVLNFISLLLLGGWAAQSYGHGGSVSKSMDLTDMNTDTLRVEWADKGQRGENDYWFTEDDGFYIGGKGLKVKEMIRINVRRSESGRFEYAQTIHARGASGAEAEENAAQTNFNVDFNGTTLHIPPGYEIREGNRWRVQEVKITIGVPEGKSIVFGKGINRRIYDADYAGSDDDYSINNYSDKVFRMTSRGLVCSDCPQFGDQNYKDDRYYEQFILEGNFDTEIIEDEDFRIEFDDPSGERGIVESIRTGENLTLTTRGKMLTGNLRCIIRTPVFTSVFAENTGLVTIRGFDEGEASISTKGNSRVKGYLDSRNLSLTLNGKSYVELIGKGDYLNANLSNGAELEASGWRTDQAEISASDGSKARLNVEQEAVIKADASSTVKVEGTARVRNN